MGKVKLIDLSGEIYEGMPVYPGHQKTVIFTAKTYEEQRRASGKGGHVSTTMGLLMSDHGPTHVDAPKHIDPSPGAKSIDQLPLELFYTDAICLDLSHLGPDQPITIEEMQKAAAKAGLSIKPGMTVLLWLGHYERKFGTDDWMYNHTGLTYEATRWLHDQGVVNVGIDAPSIDSSAEMVRKEYPAHRACRETGLLNTENLANLGQVAGRSFTFCAFPLKIRGGSGSPVRAVAILNED